MTAINMIRQRRRACILTDGAGYDSQGIVHGFYQKAVPIAHLRAAIAVRGPALAPVLFAAEFGLRFTSFDDLVALGGRHAETVYDRFFGLLTAGGHVELEIALAGWSESRNRPETYWLASDQSRSESMLGVPAWEFAGAEDFAAAPMPSAELLEEQGFDVDDIESVDPVADGLKVMEAQRRFVGNLRAVGASDGSVSAVGGFVTLTEIREDGVSQRVIRRWNDRVGEMIQPERVALVSASAPMNRAERRRWEREHRRAA